MTTLSPDLLGPLIGDSSQGEYVFAVGRSFGKAVVIDAVDMSPAMNVGSELFMELGYAMKADQSVSEYCQQPAFLLGALAGSIEQIRSTQ